MNQTLAVLCALALFPACAKKKDEKKTEQPAIETPKLVTPGLTDTDYLSNCIRGAGGESSDELLRFTPTQVMREIRDHNNNSCTSPSAVTQIVHNYTVGAHKGDSIFELDLVETEYFFIPKSDAVASFWRRTEKCGIRDWATNVRQQVRKGANCVVAEDASDRRPVYTIVKMEGKVVRTNFDVSNRDQDGMIPARRVSKLSELRYELVPRVAPTPAPGPVTNCPAFEERYACFSGHLDWEGEDLSVRNLPGNNGQRPLILISRKKAGRMDLTFQPEDPERVVEQDGRRYVTKDSCEHGILKSVRSSSLIGDTHNRVITETTFRLDERKNLRVTTLEKRVINDREERGLETPTLCEKR